MGLQIENLKFRYPKEKQDVIKGISFEVEEKSLTGIMGPSGSGKSTLMRLITGFECPAEGRIVLSGKELFGQSCIMTEDRNIGMVFQNYVLFPHLTVAQNILFGLENKGELSKAEKQQRLEEILHLIEMEKFRHAYPATLSGGQQQRVALGRALAPAPKLLLLDEPFSNLDICLKEKIRWEMKEILKQAGITSLLVTHSVEDVDITDKIILLCGGRIVNQGTYDKLSSDFSCLYSRQILNIKT